MVNVIKEDQNYFGTIYYIYKEGIKLKTVSIVRVNQVYQGYEYIYLLDSHGQVIKEVFDFVNDYCKKEAKNSREQAVSALKLLYSFLELTNKALCDLGKKEVNNLSRFLLGDIIEGNSTIISLSTKRSVSTHNQYLDTIRKFLKFLEIDNEYMFEQTVVNISKGSLGLLSHTNTTTVNKYKTNINRHQSFNSYIPKYISSPEFLKIIEFINKRASIHNLRDSLIINLMFARGMRLGEVLGLTIEDIKVHPSDSEAGILILRNRLSDRGDQQAKTCLKVVNMNDYSSSLYKEEGIGYQTVTVPKVLMKEINKYVDSSRDLFSLSEKVLENIFNNCKADSVENLNGSTYYLFLNKNGKPLTAAGFNKNLKVMFESVGVQVDKGKKRNNLSHRFRHGYAMYLIEELNKDITYVKNELRHRSIHSTMKYYNPKEETILKYTEKIQKGLLDFYQKDE